jgi:hypothetical protein
MLGAKSNTKINQRCLLSFFILTISSGISYECYAVAPEAIKPYGGDIIRPFVAFNTLYDSNFFRRSSNSNPIDEFVKQLAAGFNMDWNVSRQQFIVKANVNQSWFQNASELDYTGWDTQAQWNWWAGSNFNGEIGYTNTEKLGSFINLNTIIPNLSNNQYYFANAGYLFQPHSKIKLGFFRTATSYDNTSRKFSNNTENNAQIDLQYIKQDDDFLGLRFIATDGQYPDRNFVVGDLQDDSYTRLHYGVSWNWHAGTKTSLDGIFGYTEQQFSHLSGRDFSAMVAHFNIRWKASEKTLLELLLNRDIYQSGNVSSSFVSMQGFNINFTWHTTPKIDMKLLMSYQQQLYLGNTTTLVGTEQQKNNIGIVGANLIYSMFDNIGIEAILNYENRDSNIHNTSYENKTAGLNLIATF